MAPMKAMYAGMTGGEVVLYIAKRMELEPKVVKAVFKALQDLACAEVKKTEKFKLPHLVMLKLKHKPATKAGKRIIFGKEQDVKAKPAKKVVKAFALTRCRHVCEYTPPTDGPLTRWSFRALADDV